MADWDSMGRAVTHIRGRAFQTLGRAFHFLVRIQKLGRVFKKLGGVFEKLVRVFEKKFSAESLVKESLWKSGL